MSNWIAFLQSAMSDSKTQQPSTKRLGYITGVAIASIVSLVMLGVIVGLSINVPAIQFQFVYSTLNETVLWIIGFLLAGSSMAYIATKKSEGDSKQ